MNTNKQGSLARTDAPNANLIAAKLNDRLTAEGYGSKDNLNEYKDVLSVGTESRTAGAVAKMQQVTQQAEVIGRGIYDTCWDQLTKAQQKAFQVSSLAWADFANYQNTATSVSFSNESKIAAGGGDHYLQPTLTDGIEAYDHRDLLNSKVATTVINVGSARQDNFGEAFYPTIVLPPNEGNVRFVVENTFVMTDYLHTGDGSNGVPDGFGSVSIIDAIVDPTVLRDAAIKVIPIYSASNPVFTDEVDPWMEHNVETGALKFHQNIDLLALSNDNVLNPTQVFDSTDQLDHDVRIGQVFVKMTKGATEEVIAIDLKHVPGANFAGFMGKGTARELTLSYASRTVPLHGAIKTISGADSEILEYFNDPVRSDWVLYLDISLSGTVNLETSNIRVNGGVVQIANIWEMPVNDDNMSTPVQITNAADINGAMDAFDKIELVGWYPAASRTNLNRRTRGILARTDIMSEQYTIPMGPPISVLTPVVDTETLVDLEAPIKLNRVRNSQNAVHSLIEYGNMLKRFKNANDIRSPRPEITGIGRYLYRAYYHEAEIDLAANVDSIRSADRLEDINHSIISVIRNVATRAWAASGFGAAWQAMGLEGRPVVNVGCGPMVASYLSLAADTRILGDLFDINLVTTMNKELNDMIIINFSSDTGIEAFTSGNFYYIPEIVSTLPKTTNGGQSIQLTVQNRNMHINHLPIQVRIILKGMNDVLTAKTPIRTITTIV